MCIMKCVTWAGHSLPLHVLVPCLDNKWNPSRLHPHNPLTPGCRSNWEHLDLKPHMGKKP